MRNYLYIWHDPAAHMIVASGIELHDFLPALQDGGGVLLLKGNAQAARHDARSGLPYVPRQQLACLASEDISAWGSHAWADYASASVPALDEAALAEAHYFARHGQPLRQPRIAGTHNRFLAYGHDDGWYLKLFYTDWADVADFLDAAVPGGLGKLDPCALQGGEDGCWLQHGIAETEMKTHDIDSVLNRRL